METRLARVRGPARASLDGVSLDPPPSVPWSGWEQAGVTQSRGTGSREWALATGEAAAIRSAGFEVVGRAVGEAAYNLSRYSERYLNSHDSHRHGTPGYDSAQTEVSSPGSPD